MVPESHVVLSHAQRAHYRLTWEDRKTDRLNLVAHFVGVSETVGTDAIGRNYAKDNPFAAEAELLLAWVQAHPKWSVRTLFQELERLLPGRYTLTQYPALQRAVRKIRAPAQACRRPMRPRSATTSTLPSYHPDAYWSASKPSGSLSFLFL